MTRTASATATRQTDPGDRSAAWRAEAGATLSLAWPLIASNLTGALIHATDVFLLGKLGPETLAAGALGSNLVLTVMIFGMGLVTATAPMLARTIGHRPHAVRDVRRTVRQGLWLATLFFMPFALLLWQAEAIFLAIGQDPALSADAALFVRAMLWSVWPFLAVTVLRAFVSALEASIWALVVGAFGVVANAVLNYGLILGNFGLPALGLTGAGIGSSIVHWAMFGCLSLIVLRHRRFRRYALFGRFWRADLARLKDMTRLGAPIAFAMGFEASVFSAAVALMGLIGTVAVAAHSVALQVASLTFMVPLGLAQAITVRVGLAYGRGDQEGIRIAGWTGFAIAVGFMTLTASLLWAAPERLAGLFIDASNPANAETLRLAASFLVIAAAFQIVDGAQVTGAAMLRGLHDTFWPMLFTLVGYWAIGLGVGAFMAFRLGWGGQGIWIGLAAGLGVVSILMLARWRRRERLGLLPAQMAHP